MKFKHLLMFFFMITMTHNAFACLIEEEDEASEIRQITLKADSPIKKWDDDIILNIFSFLNQRDIPSVTRTSKSWQRLIDNNQLWQGYAKRAFVVMYNEKYSPNKNYKELVKIHCIPSFTNLGTLNGGIYSGARGVSIDGSVIVGEANDGATQNQPRAFRWTQETGMKSLGTLKNGGGSWAQSVSFDASVIVGHANDGATQNQQRAFRWAHETEMESLGTLIGGIESRARGVSSDGLVIVGEANDGAVQNQSRAFRWTPETGIKSLGTLNGGAESWARGVSSDGTVIVGYAEDGAVQNQSRAFRWTPETEIKSLGTLNAGTNSWASGVSSDGTVIVGHANDGATQNQQRAFRWTQETGMESVEKLLADKALLLPDWTLTSATAITPNGVVLVGNGQCKIQMENGDNKTQTRAWRAVIPRGNLF